MTTTAPHKRATWQDAYDAQMALWRWYRTRDGMDWLRESYEINSRGLNAATCELIRDSYESEAGRLLDCDPIFVSADMCDVVDAAAKTFHPEPLLETDLVTTRGFLYYERPFVIPDRFDEPTPVQAVSWTRMFVTDTKTEADRLQAAVEERGGLPLTRRRMGDYRGAEVMSDDPRMDEEWLLAQGVKVGGVALTLYATKRPEKMKGHVATELAPLMPAVLPMHVTPWWYGMSFDGNETDENEIPTGAEWWWRIAQTTFRLMQQKISARSFHRPDRSARREAKRLGFREATETVVVRLRREESERHEPSGEKANYSHRFIVGGSTGGFWRQQWYPSISAHRQIWIDPYVKGDPGLPLIVKPRRAFEWKR